MTSAPDVSLEPIRAEHAVALYPLLADHSLWQFTDDEPPRSEAALAERYRRLESGTSPDGTERWLNWAVRYESAVVGFLQATVVGSHAEIAYVIGSAHQRRGLATAAVSSLIAALKERHAVVSLGAVVDARNIASLRLLARCGFELVDARDEKNLRFARMDAGGPH